jgi:hypothetical protein
MVKEKVQEETPEKVEEGELSRPAAAAVATGTWTPAPAAASKAPGQGGLGGLIMGLLAALDHLLAGPAMTEQERHRRQLAEVRAETKRRLSMYN